MKRWLALVLVCCSFGIASGQNDQSTYFTPGGLNAPLARWTFPSAAERTGSVGYFAQDIGKVGFQADTGQFFYLVDPTPTWAVAGGAPVAGADKQVIFNDGGSAYGADADLTWDKTANVLTLNGSIVGGGAVPTGGSTGQVVTKNSATNYDYSWSSPSGTGTVTSFSAGNLSPLFTTSVTSPTSAPALSFTLSTAGANTVFGNPSGSTAAPVFSSSPRFTAIGNLNTNGFIKTSGGLGTLSVDTNTYLTSAVTSVATTSPITGGTITTTGTIGFATNVDLALVTPQSVKVNDAATGVTNVLTLSHDTTGTPGANLGPAISFQAETDTTLDQAQGSIASGWTDATQATRTSFIELKAVLNGTQHSVAQGLRLWGSRGATLNRSVDPGAGNFDISGVYETGGTQIGTNDLAASATNDTPASGKIGQTVSSAIVSGSAGAFTSGTIKNITSISLTAGDWDVRGEVTMTGASIGAANYDTLKANIGTTSATLTDDGMWAFAEASNPAASAQTIAITATLASRRVSLASTTTVYLIAQAVFGTGTATGYGYIEARRMR